MVRGQNAHPGTGKALSGTLDFPGASVNYNWKVGVASVFKGWGFKEVETLRSREGFGQPSCGTCHGSLAVTLTDTKSFKSGIIRRGSKAEGPQALPHKAPEVSPRSLD